MNIAEFAKKLSHELHGEQKRNDGVTPYTVHTDYVGDNAYKFHCGESYLYTQYIVSAVGYCHDTGEDVENGLEILQERGVKKFGDIWNEVVMNVGFLSRFSKEIPIIRYLEVIKTSDIAKAVKLADLEHNLSYLKPGNLRDKYELCRHFLLN